MSGHSYLKWPAAGHGSASWHVIARVDDEGWLLRCGRRLTTEKAQASDHLPPGDRSCETCLRFTLADEETPPNDPVTDG